MSHCERYQEILPAYLDGEATAEEKAILESHLKRCPECRAVEKRLKNLQLALRSLPRITTSPDFNIALRTRIRLEERRAATPILSFPGFSRVPAFGLAAAAVAALFLLLVGQTRQPQPVLTQKAPAVSVQRNTQELPPPIVTPPPRNVKYVMERIPIKMLKPRSETVSIDSRHRPSRVDSASRDGSLRMLATRIYRVSF